MAIYVSKAAGIIALALGDNSQRFEPLVSKISSDNMQAMLGTPNSNTVQSRQMLKLSIGECIL